VHIHWLLEFILQRSGPESLAQQHLVHFINRRLVSIDLFAIKVGRVEFLFPIEPSRF
jgi:hypothetical protein